MSTQEIKKYNKKILLGIDDDRNAIVVELSIGNTYTTPENRYLSITHDIYDMADVLMDEEGKQRAREYLQDDDYIWKEAVAEDRTTLGFDDWVEEILRIDGWTEVFGDLYSIDYDHYVPLIGCGCGVGIDERLDLKHFAVIDGDVEVIINAFNTLHLKPVMIMNEQEKSLMNRVKAIFEKYPAFEIEQLKQYLPKEEVETEQ